MLNADCPSSPEVGSSRKRRSWGLDASSTPIVTRLRAVRNFTIISIPKRESRMTGIHTLDIKSESGETNHGIGQVLELEQLDNFLNLYA